jgi:hypothetical protein
MLGRGGRAGRVEIKDGWQGRNEGMDEKRMKG